jgi:phenylpropionate dioxygenase-like ring-hydroxylating dioxygenase large terminal subunit
MLIKNQWYVVLDSQEVKKKKLTAVKRMNEQMVFWRSEEGKVVCMVDQCPHLGARLSHGKWIGDHIQCPFHGFEFDTSGNCQRIPAQGGTSNFQKVVQVKTYPTHEAHGFVWIYWGETTEKLESPEFFNDIDTRFSFSRITSEWNVHYSRMVENQLDVMHLPFVHYNTIGAGGHTVVDGPQVKLEKGWLYVWVHNRSEDGTPARSAEELPDPIWPPMLIFRFPNLWENRISDDMRIVVAFVPVDEDHGKFYGRFYQRIVRTPILRGIVNVFGKLGSMVIANQDKRIVTQQEPKRTQLKKMGEKITPGDRAILTYRTYRHKLMVESGQIKNE